MLLWLFDSIPLYKCRKLRIPRNHPQQKAFRPQPWLANFPNHYSPCRLRLPKQYRKQTLVIYIPILYGGLKAITVSPDCTLKHSAP